MGVAQGVPQGLVVIAAPDRHDILHIAINHRVIQEQHLVAQRLVRRFEPDHPRATSSRSGSGLSEVICVIRFVGTQAGARLEYRQAQQIDGGNSFRQVFTNRIWHLVQTASFVKGKRLERQ